MAGASASRIVTGRARMASYNLEDHHGRMQAARLRLGVPSSRASGAFKINAMAGKHPSGQEAMPPGHEEDSNYSGEQGRLSHRAAPRS